MSESFSRQIILKGSFIIKSERKEKSGNSAQQHKKKQMIFQQLQKSKKSEAIKLYTESDLEISELEFATRIKL